MESRGDLATPRRPGPSASASMIVVQLHLGHVAIWPAVDPIRALAQQVAGEQPLTFFAGDDLSRRRLPLGNYQRRALVSHADIEIKLVEGRFDFGPFLHVAHDLERLHDTKDGPADDVTPCRPSPALLGEKLLDRLAIDVAGIKFHRDALPDTNAHEHVKQHGGYRPQDKSI